MYSCDPHVPDVLDLAHVQSTSYVPAVEQVSDVTEPNAVLFRRVVDWTVCTFIATAAGVGTLTVTDEYPSALSLDALYVPFAVMVLVISVAELPPLGKK